MTYGAPVADRAGPEEGALLWRPRPKMVARSRLTDYATWLARERGMSTAGYPELWEWSTTDIAYFWDSIWRYFEVVGDRSQGPVLTGGAMPEVAWYPGATLNYAENALRCISGPAVALIAFSELRPKLQLSGAEISQQVRRHRLHIEAFAFQLGVSAHDHHGNVGVGSSVRPARSQSAASSGQ